MTPLLAIDARVGDAALPTRAMLIVLLAGVSLAFSMAFACATPFAALATVAVWRMRRRDALAVVTLGWLVNQADGYLFMHYPQSWSSFAWGAAIGLAAMTAAFGAAIAIELAQRHPPAAICSAFATAFVSYEGALIAASFVLPTTPGAFSLSVILRLLAIDAVAFVLLVLLTGTLVGTSLPTRPTPPHDEAGPDQSIA